jgi:hypothetical protein
MDIYELLKVCNISLVEINGKPEIAEQLTVESLQEVVNQVKNQARLAEKHRTNRL